MKLTIKTLALITVGLALGLIHPGVTHAASLVQYWPFDELPGAATSSNRVSGGNSAILVNADTNAAWINSGLASQLTNSTGAVTLDGVDDYVNLGVFGLNNPATLSMWLKPNDFSGDVRLFSPLDFNATYAGLIRFDTFGSASVQEISNIPGSWPNVWYSLTNISAVPVGQWTHLTVVYSAGGIVSLYINGVKSGQIFGGFRFAQSQFGLGAQFNGTGKSFSGAIDDMSVWNGALSSNSIAQLAAGVSPTNIVDVAPAPQGANLVQYFALDDGVGSSTAANGVGGGNTGNLVNFDVNTQWTNDKPSQLTSSSSALVFDGTNYVDLGNVHLFGSGAVSLWLKPRTNNLDMRIYAQLSGLANNPGLIGLDIAGVGGMGVFNSAVYARIAPSGVVPTNQWTHLVVSYDNGYATAYINGVPQITTSAVFAFGSDSFGLGANFRLTTGGKFRGLIDDVSIWDGPLSSASIQQLASGTSPQSIVDTPQTQPGASLSFSITNPPGATIKQYFPLEGPDSSTNAANLVTGGNTGRLINYTASLAPWTNGGLAVQLTNSTSALIMDGTGNYANLGNVGLSDPCSVSLWIKPTTVTAGGMLFAQLSGPASGTSAHQGAVGLTGSGGLFVRGSVTQLAPDGTIAANQWSHVAVVYNAGTVTAYVNGTNINSATAGSTFNTDPFGIGAPLWALTTPLYQNFPGQMDDVSLWNGPLSEADIQSLAAGVSPLNVTASAGLVQYFPLNESGTNLTLTNAVVGGNPGQLINYSAVARSWESNNIPSALPGSTRSLFLDGINDYLNVGNVALSGSGTVSLWINPNTLAGDQRLISQLTGATTQQGHVGYRPTGEVWSWAGNIYRYPGVAGTVSAGQWYHLVLAFGGGYVTLYVNGVEKGTDLCGLQFNGVEMGLGAKWINLYGNSVSGFLDDISIWDKPVSPDTVVKLASGVPPNTIVDTPRNLVLTWAAYPGGYYSVQTSTDVSGPWMPLVQPTTLTGTNYTVSIPMSSSGMKYYRLVKR